MILPLAFAFQIGSPVSGACHEAITLAGSTRAGFPDPAAAPRPTENQARALDDLTFALPADREDVWTMTLVIGVRSNDVHDGFHTGLYVGGSLLGIAFKRGPSWRITFDPSHFAMPTPQVTGVRFYYQQYRISVGAEYRF